MVNNKEMTKKSNKAKEELNDEELDNVSGGLVEFIKDPPEKLSRFEERKMLGLPPHPTDLENMYGKKLTYEGYIRSFSREYSMEQLNAAWGGRPRGDDK